LDNTLRLLHPFMPYVTEEIWQHVAVTDKQSASIVTAHYPALLQRDEGAEAEMDIIMETVTGIRTIRGELNLSPSLELRACVKTQSDKAEDVLKRNLAYLDKLARADITEIGAGVRKPGGAAAAVRDYVEVYVPLEGLLNIELEIDRLRKDEAKVEETIAFLNKKLLNEDFLSRAPQAIIAKEKEKYEECLRKKDRVLENIRKLYEVGGKK
ncbi:MAG TPA: class I tRNA ligase family protein, partial [Candidatus Sulfobium mesophilum]|nr:class I tRNA ligase family protein [Candidatus Sulfobium mesophilum]